MILLLLLISNFFLVQEFIFYKITDNLTNHRICYILNPAWLNYDGCCYRASDRLWPACGSFHEKDQRLCTRHVYDAGTCCQSFHRTGWKGVYGKSHLPSADLFICLVILFRPWYGHRSTLCDDSQVVSMSHLHVTAVHIKDLRHSAWSAVGSDYT